MKLIIVNGKHNESRTLSFSRRAVAMLSLFLLGAPIGLGVLAYKAGQHEAGGLDQQALEAISQQLDNEKAEVAATRNATEQQLRAMTLKMAQLQARLLRIDALGERLTTVAKLDKGEFDFSQTPAVGGPETSVADSDYAETNFLQSIDQLAQRIDDRQQQLEILDSLMHKRKIEDDIALAGRPINKGWLSSYYGHRNDPFTGRVAMHEGVDFAGKEGADVVAVASGVVTWSGERYGYGQMVEVNHGSGFMTRYAHNKNNLVSPGDIVKKGQVLAHMGSSGRSTGPHVHFEVYKHGRPVDPLTYIRRTRR